MAHNIQLWTADFAKNLYNNVDFYSVGKNHSSYIRGNIVHIPNVTNSPNISVLTTGTSLPVATTKATYSDLTYSPITLISEPMFVHDIDAVEASFDTRSALMEEVVLKLQRSIGNKIIYDWAPAVTSTGSIISSTGAVRANYFGNTGVKKLTLADLTAARIVLEKTAKRGDDLYLVVDSYQFADIVEFAGAALQYTSSSVLTSAVIAEYAGFKIIKRFEALGYTHGIAAKVAFDAVAPNTSLSAALAFSASCVSYAIGDLKMGVQPFATGIYEDVIQARVRCAGSPMYPVASNTMTGVVAIIENDTTSS